MKVNRLIAFIASAFLVAGSMGNSHSACLRAFYLRDGTTGFRQSTRRLDPTAECPGWR